MSFSFTVYLPSTGIPSHLPLPNHIANNPPTQTGKVSPRNSRANSTGEGSVALGAGTSTGKRGSVSTASTNSPVESSPLRWELSADGTGAPVAAAGVDAGAGGSGMEMGSIREE